MPGNAVALRPSGQRAVTFAAAAAPLRWRAEVLGMRIRVFTVIPATVVLLAGCSISDSISSPFESSSASLASSSRSSGSSSPARRESYRNDVRDYTAAYVKSSQDLDAFRRGIADIASKHKVSDWESDMDTYVGIGAGLRKANVKPAQFEVWQTNLSGGDTSKATAMQQGYAEGK